MIKTLRRGRKDKTKGISLYTETILDDIERENAQQPTSPPLSPTAPPATAPFTTPSQPSTPPPVPQKQNKPAPPPRRSWGKLGQSAPDIFKKGSPPPVPNREHPSDARKIQRSPLSNENNGSLGVSAPQVCDPSILIYLFDCFS